MLHDEFKLESLQEGDTIIVTNSKENTQYIEDLLPMEGYIVMWAECGEIITELWDLPNKVIVWCDGQDDLRALWFNIHADDRLYVVDSIRPPSALKVDKFTMQQTIDFIKEHTKRGAQSDQLSNRDSQGDNR